MPKSPKDVLNSLSPLPGGISDYLNTLVQILEWIEHSALPRYDKFAEWIMAEFTTGRAMVNVYLRVLVRLSVVQKLNNNGLALTTFGKQILTSSIDDRARLLGDYLIRRYAAAREVLAIYAQASEPIHLDTVI